MTNEEYIQLHRSEDVRQLALKRVPEGVDATWCLEQIEGWQTATRKLPRWAETEGVWFPPRLSMEQCSSELTATYKQQVVERWIPEGERAKMADFTGGFGIDFSYMARAFREATYMERQERLCEIARHNLPLLGLPEARVVCGDSTKEIAGDYDLIFLDPARRDTAGRKTVQLEDCTPNVVTLWVQLTSSARHIMLKLSPMLDISQALRSLSGVREVHVVSVQGECKELLLCVDCSSVSDEITYHCVNLGTEDDTVVCKATERNVQVPIATLPHDQEFYLFEPNASVLKAGVQDVLCQQKGVQKLHTLSHLFVSTEPLPHFPGRQFRVVDWGDFSKSSLKRLTGDLNQANLTVRNFPTSVAELRKKLRLREGGSVYLFATTLADGSHALLRCVK